MGGWVGKRRGREKEEEGRGGGRGQSGKDRKTGEGREREQRGRRENGVRTHLQTVPRNGERADVVVGVGVLLEVGLDGVGGLAEREKDRQGRSETRRTKQGGRGVGTHFLRLLRVAGLLLLCETLENLGVAVEEDGSGGV